MVHELRRLHQAVTNLDRAIKIIAEKQTKMGSVLDEMKALIEEGLKKNFTIKGGPFEVSSIKLETKSLL